MENSRTIALMRFNAFVLGTLALLFLIIATPTHHWYHVKMVKGNSTIQIFAGLFEKCTEFDSKLYICSTRDPESFLTAVRVFMLMAIVCIIITVIYVLLTTFSRGINFKILSTLLITTALLVMIAMSIFTYRNRYHSNYINMEFGWSYILGWVSFLFLMLSGISCCFANIPYERI